MFAARNNASVFASLAVAFSLFLFSPSVIAADGSLVLAPDGSYRFDRVLYTRLNPGYWRGRSGTQDLNGLGNVVAKDVATRCGRPFQFRYTESAPPSTYWDVGDNMDGCIADFVANYISRPHTVSTLSPPQLQQNPGGNPYATTPTGERWSWKTSVYGQPYSRDAYSAYFELVGHPDILVCPALAPVWSADTGACSCPGEIRYSATFRGDRCFPMERYRLEITTVTPGGSLPDIELEPEATVELMVRVFDAQDRPVPFVQVRVEVSVDETSGGHDHGGADRPRGALSGFNGANWVSGTTDASGLYYFSFTAPEASGDHKLRATCVGQVCDDAEEDVSVGVQGLVPLPPSTYGYYELIGGSDDGKNTHYPNSDTHYLTLGSAAKAITLAAAYRQKFPGDPVLHYNDASLERGGLFDVHGDWASPHIEHRRGTVVDVRANPSINPETAIPARNFEQFIKLTKTFSPAYASLHHEGANTQHFHVRLMGEEE